MVSEFRPKSYGATLSGDDVQLRGCRCGSAACRRGCAILKAKRAERLLVDRFKAAGVSLVSMWTITQDSGRFPDWEHITKTRVVHRFMKHV